MARDKIVFWESGTGAKGNGKKHPPDTADAWVAYGNEQYPTVVHRAIEAKICLFEIRGEGR